MNDSPPFVARPDPLIAPLVPGYLKNREQDLGKIEQALAARDFAGLRRLGHNMRGSAGGYGLPPLSQIGGRIEDAAVANDAAAIGTALDEMRGFLKTVKLAP
ncbi:MAG: Hpt domain-containing protein [Nevskiaceae bacterium]